MNFGASLLEGDFVHVELHDVKAAPTVGIKSLGGRGVRNLVRIEPVALVSDDNGDSVARVATAMNMHSLSRVHPVPCTTALFRASRRAISTELWPGTQLASSISSMSRFTNGEIWLISLGIETSASIDRGPLVGFISHHLAFSSSSANSYYASAVPG
jgi:hypothetical protein